MSVLTPRQLLFRAVPKLDPKIVSDDAAAFVMERAAEPRWLGEGRFKQAIDLGNGLVAKFYRYEWDEDRRHDPCRPYSPFDLRPTETQVFEKRRVDVEPLLSPVSQFVSDHLYAILYEQGIDWRDAKSINAGIARDGSGKVMLFDGTLSRHRFVQQVRLYKLIERSEGRQQPIVVIGDNKNGRWFFRNLAGKPDSGEWKLDWSLMSLFEKSPPEAGPWLRPCSWLLRTFGLSYGQFQQLAAGTPPRLFDADKGIQPAGRGNSERVIS